MMEMKEADKGLFLHTPVMSGSLFGPAVEGFAERFTEAQKLSQVMRHFLPKHTSSSSASSRSSAQSFSENAGPYGSGFVGNSVGSASHATHQVLAEAEGSIRGLASRTPPRNGDSACVSVPGLLEGPLLAKARCDPRHTEGRLWYVSVFPPGVPALPRQGPESIH